MYYGANHTVLQLHRRTGQPTETHNRKLCQACNDGSCKFDWRFS